MRTIKTLSMLLAMTLAAPLLADTTGDAYSQAEVRRVDADNSRVTLRHGPIDNLQMPPMTMVFRVSNADDLKDLVPGDQVRFKAEEQDGSYVVTSLQKNAEDEHAGHH